MLVLLAVLFAVSRPEPTQAQSTADQGQTPQAVPDKDFDFGMAPGQAAGMWSNGTTMWVAEGFDGNIHAYRLKLSGGESDPSNYMALDPSNTSPVGIWSDNEFMWVVDLPDKKVYVYNLDTKERAAGKEFDLDANKHRSMNHDSHDMAMGAWSDGQTIWIIDGDDVKLYAYNLADGERQKGKEFDLDDANDDPRDLWSDGTTVWVTDLDDVKLYAYSLDGGTRQARKDILLPEANNLPSGVWSDGTTMWVGQVGHRLWSGIFGDKAFAYDVSDLTAAAPEPEAAFVIYHDPDAGAAAVDRHQQATALLTAAGLSYDEVTGATAHSEVVRLTGLSNTVMPRFFLGDPTDEDWTSQPGTNNGGLRWLRAKAAEVAGIIVAPVDGSLTSLAVSWRAHPDADKYEVSYRSTDPEFCCARSFTTTSTTLTGLAAETDYMVRVDAIDTDADPDLVVARHEAEAATGSTRPIRVTVPVPTVANQLTVIWRAMPGASGYKVQWRSGAEDWDAAARQRTVTGGDAWHDTIPGLDGGTTYSIRVIATVTGQADSSPSAVVAQKALHPAPAAPTDVVVTAIDFNGWLVTFTPSTTPEVTRYDIVYSICGLRATPHRVTSGDLTQYVIRFQDLRNRTNSCIYLSVEAVRPDAVRTGDSQPAGNALVSGAANAVTDIAAVHNGAAVDVTWTAAADADGYKVFWTELDSVSGEPEFIQDPPKVISGGDTAAATLTAADGIVAGSRYRIWVLATEQGKGDSPFADPAYADTTAPTGSEAAPPEAAPPEAAPPEAAPSEDEGDSPGADDPGTTDTTVQATSKAPAASFVIYHDPDAGAAAVDRYNQAVALLKAAAISYREVTGDVHATVDRLAGVSNSVMPRFFLGDPTDGDWVSQPRVNNGGLRWLKSKAAELSGSKN